MTPKGIHPHELVLKPNCSIILLRNFNPSKGLCNGTWLICHNFQLNAIDAEIATGYYSSKIVFIPRIPFIPIENKNKKIYFHSKGLNFQYTWVLQWLQIKLKDELLTL